MSTKSLSRRNFLRITSLSGTAFCLGLYYPASAKDGIIKTIESEVADIELSAWILINPSGKVSLISHRAEMGQGVYNSLAQIIAEELEVNLDEVNIEFGQGDNKKYGSQITGGSSTISSSYQNLLKLGATARIMLVQAAANKWSVPVNDCYARGGHVFHKPTGKKLHYGELVAAASKLEAPKDIPLKKRSDYKIIGKPIHRQDTPMKTNGTAIFGLDKKLPGMLYAMVERNPRLRGKIKSYDDTETLKIAGVKKVFKVQMKVFETIREGVAVVADSVYAALQGKRALKIEWDDTGFEHVNTIDIYKQQQEDLNTKEGLVFKTKGDANSILEKADKLVDVLYQTPYQSHSSMEPLNCVAHYQADKIEIWGPIQAPDWVQQFISKEMGLPMEKVLVNMTFLGGGFGRKAFLDYPHEAVLISKEMGTPIQVIWTREDDVTQGPYRPGITYRCQGVVNNGQIGAYKVKLSGQNIDHWFGADRSKPNSSASEGLLKQFIDSIENLSIQDVPFETPVPIMWWRSVYASTNGFAFESFMDELAHAAGKDPLEFRKSLIKEERVLKQIEKLATVSGWKNKKKNEGFGVAITECFGTTVGQVVKVSKNAAGKINIDKVWAVVDCGWYVNPDIIKAQVEGSVVMGLGAATTHEITFKNGLTQQNNFYDYRMPRITDAPVVEVHLMENNENGTGVGEPGLPPFAPALTNAIFDLTGKRIRKLPFNMEEV